MTLLHVQAHWSNALPPGPPPAAPVPGWTSAYPGTVPLVPFTPGPPAWPASPTGPVGGSEYEVWVPLVAMSTLDSIGWSFGPNWAGSPPPAWPTSSGVAVNTYDEGYPAGATGFVVNRLRLFQESAPGNDHVYRVSDPSGQVIGTVTSTGPGWTSVLTVPGPAVDRQGIWTVRITRTGGSAVSAPGLFPDAASPGNTLDEPYVSPYGDRFEGVLGVEFDGTAIVPSNCWDDIALSHADPIPCVETVGGTAHVSFIATVSPATPAYAGPYQWRLLRGTTILEPWTAGTATFDRDLPVGVDYKVSVRVLQPSCLETVLLDAFTFSLAACTPCAIAVATPPPIPCSSGAPTTPVLFTASTTTGFSGPFTWEVFDRSNPNPQAPPISQTTSGTTFSTTFPRPGIYRVTASFATVGCPNPTASDGVDVIVPDCNCPLLTGQLTATATSPCQYTFAVGITLPPRVRTVLEDGRLLYVDVRTGYPADGNVSVEVLRSSDEPWTLTLRVPSWAEGATVHEELRVGRRQYPASVGLVQVTHAFEAGDIVRLVLPSEPRIVHPDPRIDAVRGCVAVEQGPRVLCLESVDLAASFSGGEVAVGDVALQSVESLRCEASTVYVDLQRLAPSDRPWPYGRRDEGDPDEPADSGQVPLVPYHAWGNRGLSTMRVWLPLAQPPGPRQT